MVSIRDGHTIKKYIVCGNPSGKVNIIEHGTKVVYKELPIDLMQCSMVHGSHLFIGAGSKVYLVDLDRDFEIISHCSFSRQVFSICPMTPTKFIIGQQAGFLGLAELKNDGTLVKEAETKVTSAIFKVIMTSSDEIALACSGGLYFANYDAQRKRFIVS